MTTMFASDSARDSFTDRCILGDSRRMTSRELLADWRRWKNHLDGRTGASIAAVLWTRALTPEGK